jgi:hypothetical protein
VKQTAVEAQATGPAPEFSLAVSADRAIKTAVTSAEHRFLLARMAESPVFRLSSSLTPAFAGNRAGPHLAAIGVT